MVRIRYRRPNSFYSPKREGRFVSSFDELLDLLLDELINRPGPVSGASFILREQSARENLRSHRLWEADRQTIGRQKNEPSNQPCSRCGIKFSRNLMKNGLCNNCRSGGKAESQDPGHQDRGVSPPVSDKALREAYEILGCDENDSDDIIKRRHRELAKEFHSDRLSPGASCDRIGHANESFCKVQEAYEIIMIKRKKIT
jgi:DnaJ-domain-containing protein 1